MHLFMYLFIYCLTQCKGKEHINKSGIHKLNKYIQVKIKWKSK